MADALLTIIILALLIGLLAGFVGGLLGVGGGIIFVPGLLLLLPDALHNDFNYAKTASLFAITFLAMVGTVRHYQYGSVNVRLGLVLGLSGVVGALLGSFMGANLPVYALELAFAGIMLWSAAQLRKPPGGDHEMTMQEQLVIGFGGGVLAGLLGVGGGIILVNGMLLLGVNAHMAVGSSMMAVILNSGSGLAGNVYFGFLELRVALPLTAGALVGVYFGATKANSVDQDSLRGYFRLAMVVLGLYMLVRGLMTAGILSF